MSDRLYLDEACPTLQLLLQRLVDEPGVKLEEKDFQDFEVAYSTAMEGDVLVLKVIYPFLAQVWEEGAQELLQRLWEGLPLRTALQQGELKVALETSSLSRIPPDQAKRCVDRLACTRVSLLVGPLVQRLAWLRDAVLLGDQAAQKAPQDSQQARTKAMGAPPKPLVLQLRQLETTCIVPKQDRVVVILSVHLDDEVDVALGRAFCQEFAETNRKGNEFSLPCSFHEPKDRDQLSDLRGLPVNVTPNVGFLTLTLTDQHVRGASEDRLIALARPVMTFRNFFLFHLKHTKSFLHSRLRKRLDHWQQQIGKARRKRQQEKRRLVSGKEFVPPSR